MNVDRALQHYGLLLQQDKKLPSVAGLIAGEALSTSWWSHPKAQAIFAALERLSDRDDVLVSRLIAGKVTYVYKTLWPAFLAVAMSATVEGLSAGAKKLLAEVEHSGTMRAKGESVRELQQHLLVAAHEVHTESGKHEIEIETWQRWARRHRAVPMTDIDTARETLERAAVSLGAPVSSLPWRKRGKKP